jgi:hypothetical protein
VERLFPLFYTFISEIGGAGANHVELGYSEGMRGGWKLPYPGEEVYRFEIGIDLGVSATGCR